MAAYAVIAGYCAACGGYEQPVCLVGSPVCEPGLVGYQGTCVPCGGENQLWCGPGQAPCTDTWNQRLMPTTDGLCSVCGGAGQRFCGAGRMCDFPQIPEGDGICHACNEGGQPCESTVYRKYNNAFHFYTLTSWEGYQYGYYNEWFGDFYLQRQESEGTVPLYRCNVPGAGHTYFTWWPSPSYYGSTGYCDGVPGATYESFMGYMDQYGTLPGSVPLYQIHAGNQDYVYTTSYAEAVRAYYNGYPHWDGVVGYVWAFAD
jgi:hypothetical protein